MKSGVPWNVRGVRAEVRDTAREAARRCGLSVGEWLDTVIIERATEEGVPPPDPEPAEEVPINQALAQTIERIERRIDQLIAQNNSVARGGGPEAYAPRGALAASAPPPPPLASAPYPNGSNWASNVDQAVAEISLRQRALDGDPEAAAAYPQRASEPQRPPLGAPWPSQDLSGLEQQLRHITTQIENLHRPNALESAIAALRKDLTDINRTITDAMPKRAIETLESEIRKLAERVDQNRQSIDSGSIASMERGLAEVLQALRALTPAENLVGIDEAVRGIARKIDQIATTQQDPGALAQLDAAITALRGIVSHVASNDALANLTDEVRGLSAKIDRLATSAGTAAEAGLLTPQLKSQLDEFTEQLKRANAGIAAAEPRGSDLARAEDSLEAVHTTIDHVVDRLATIESEVRSAQIIEPAMPAPPPAAPPSPPQPASSPLAIPIPVAGPPQTAPAAPSVRRGPPPQRKVDPIDPHLPPDYPLEPGSGVPRARPSASAADRIKASEAALGAAKPQALTSGHTDFIAAARRAAQAAVPAVATDEMRPEPAKTDKKSGKTIGQRVRSLLVGASVFLIVVGAFRTAIYLLDPSEPPAAENPAPQVKQAAHADRNENRPAATLRSPASQQSALERSIESVLAAPPRQLTLTGPQEKPAATQQASAPPDEDDDVITGSIGSPAIKQPAGPAEPIPALQKPAQRPGLSDKLPAGLRKAAADGNPAAAYEVGLRYLEGRGIAQSAEEAARWLDHAAKSGLAPAQFRLGSLYEKGQGVKKNREAALRLYAAAAEAGNAKAMHNLAVLYAEGANGKPDYKAAAIWFRKASNHGISDSQYNLGILYARGVGVEQNLVESYKWFTLAAAQGDKEAAVKRDDVGSRLDAQALMAAKLAAQAFAPEPQPEQATLVKGPDGGWDRPSAQTPAPAKKRARDSLPLPPPLPLKVG